MVLNLGWNFPVYRGVDDVSHQWTSADYAVKHENLEILLCLLALGVFPKVNDIDSYITLVTVIKLLLLTYVLLHIGCEILRHAY